MAHVDPPPMTLGGDYWLGGFDIDVTADDLPPVWGAADTHAHPMSYLGFGGSFVFGRPDGDPATALGHCRPAHGLGGTGILGSVGSVFMAFVEGSFGHLEGGYPEFDGWPRFTTTIHQQMYVDWIRRAVQGGLRLMVALAVNNRLLATEFGGNDEGDRESVRRQVDELRAFASRHPDLMEVVGDPVSARLVIASGRLAIVPGVEVDSLGDWTAAGVASKDEILGYLHELYTDLGIRHIFPIHLSDNAFGGTAVFGDMFNALNHHLRGDYYRAENASAAGIDYRLGEAEGAAVAALRVTRGFAPPDYGQIPGGHANQFALTNDGVTAIEVMMDLGMIIDTDHLSQRALNQTLIMADQRLYPVVAGHSAARSLAWRRGETSQVHKMPSEYMRSDDDIVRISANGGLFAVGLHQGDVRPQDGQVPNDAAGSSKSWAQGYLRVRQLTGGGPVAIGTDMDGLAGSSGPRFGLNACHDLSFGDKPDEIRRGLRREQVDAQSNGVRYAEPIVDYRAYRFSGELEGEVYTQEERDIWEAIAIHVSGVDPATAEMPNIFGRTPFQVNKIRNLAKGFRATAVDQLESPVLFGGNTHAEQLAAFRTASGQPPLPEDEPEARRLYDVIARIWRSWNAMTGDNAPLRRSFAGRRDFDINLDGVAHYGMLPDFFQDLRNVGLTPTQLGSLFSSAEGYLRTWQRCWEAAGGLRVRVTPTEATIGQPVTVVVHVVDPRTGQPAAGTVTVDGGPTGATDGPITHTFTELTTAVWVDVPGHPRGRVPLTLAPHGGLRITLQPKHIQVDTPTEMVVHAVDDLSGIPVSGDVLLDGTVSGRTNVPFMASLVRKRTRTFDPETHQWLVEVTETAGEVRAATYPPTDIPFVLVDGPPPQTPLRVSVTPNQVILGQSATLTVAAVDSVDGNPVAGTVSIDGGPTGATDTAITHTFTELTTAVWVDAPGRPRARVPLTIAPHGQLRISVEPAPVPVGTPTQVVVHAVDDLTGAPVGGDVFLDGVAAGRTDVPLTATFTNTRTRTFDPEIKKWIVEFDRTSGEVRAPAYPPTLIPFTF